MKSSPLNGISCCLLFCHFQLLKLVNMRLLHIGQGSEGEEQKVASIKEKPRLQGLHSASGGFRSVLAVAGINTVFLKQA